MNAALTRCLNDLESRIDEQQEEHFQQSWRAFLDGELTDGVFTPPNRTPAPAGVEWPRVHINDAFDDIDLMVLREFAAVSATLAAGGNLSLNVRSNYGVGIMASQCGCKVVQMDRKQGNLPTTLPLGSIDAVRDVLEAGVPNLRAGLGAKVFDTGERFAEVFDKYPNIGRWVSLYHPDAQGPIDNLELVWGSSFFYAIYDAPDFVDDLMGLMTDHYAAFMRKWFAMVPPTSDYSCHWGCMLKGQLMIRNDSLMNLSPQQYERFIFAHDQRLLGEFGGGAIHFCGRGDHFIEAMSRTENLTTIQLSQPHLNDMDTIYANTIDKGLMLMDLAPNAAGSAHRDLMGRVHCHVGGRAS